MSSASELKKLFEQRVKLQPSTSLLEVKLSSRALGDEQMSDLGRYLDSILPDADPNATEEAVWANVELAENNIGNAGLISVLDALDRHRVACKSIKLYRNKICDEGGIRLAEFVRRQSSGVDEIHLSHNMFSARSLVVLCMALAKHEGYPAVGRNRLYIPCWVRMEYNNIARPQEVLEMLRRDGPITICLAENRDDCGPWRCACSNKDKALVPKVHLFAIANQSRRPNPLEDSELIKEIRRWGGQPQTVSPVVRKAAPTLPTGPRGVVPPKAGTNCTTPTASMANAPPRAPVWDVSPLQRARTAPAVVSDANEDESSRSGKNDEIQKDKDLSADGSSVARKGNAWSSFPKFNNSPAPAKSESDFCMSDKDDSPIREASDPENFDPPVRSPACENGRQAAAEAAAGALLKRLQGSDGAKPAAPGGKAETSSSTRKSLVLDGGGRRRIHPNQLVEADNSAPFICPLCHFVIARPIITTCSHLFCEACFRTWVSDQVSKQKSQQPSGGPVPLIPCPQTGCTRKLKKQDIVLLNKADSTKVAAAALLQRLRNNLRVRCVHHVDHFTHAFGTDAKRLEKETGMKCNWIGDLMAYEEHVQKGCPIENRLTERIAASQNGHSSGAVAPPPPPVRAGASNSSPTAQKAEACDDAKVIKAQAAQKPAVEHTRMNGNSGNSGNGALTAVQDSVAQGDNDDDDGEINEVRVAQYDYHPRDSDKDQLPLKRHDFVRVWKKTATGWAAGVRLKRNTGGSGEEYEEVGSPGWFPEGYLFPMTAGVKDQAPPQEGS